MNRQDAEGAKGIQSKEEKRGLLNDRHSSRIPDPQKTMLRVFSCLGVLRGLAVNNLLAFLAVQICLEGIFEHGPATRISRKNRIGSEP